MDGTGKGWRLADSKARYPEHYVVLEVIIECIMLFLVLLQAESQQKPSKAQTVTGLHQLHQASRTPACLFFFCVVPMALFIPVV